MPRAEFTVELPEGVWIGDVSRAHPAATFRVLSAFPDEESGYGLLEIDADDPWTLVAEIREHGAVQSLEVVQEGTDRVVVQFETTELPLLVTVQQARVPLELPIELREGRLTLEITAPRERLSAFDEQLRALQVPHTLNRIYRTVEAEDPLTDSQRELLVTAIREGYYDTPRAVTLTELAEAVGMAASTASETLHRAEETVIKEFAAARLDLDEEELSG